MKPSASILHLLPHNVGATDGVGDYAAILSAALARLGPCQNTMVRGELPPDAMADHVILHYVNYGYQSRGVPLRMLSQWRQLRRNCRGMFLTIFHELYAEGTIRQSAFWLQPLQKYVARELARISDCCLVSNEIALTQLRALVPDVRAQVHAVFSNLGEPTLSPEQFATRSPHRWIIAGGTMSLAKSVASFCRLQGHIPGDAAPQELVLIGGEDNRLIRSAIGDIAAIHVEYRPKIQTSEASHLLAGCAFGWVDYFHRPDAPTAMILKSSIFAAYCAHGVITIFPHCVQRLAGEVASGLPGPFFVDSGSSHVPITDRAAVAARTYAWYQCRAASGVTARAIAELLGFK